MQGVDLDLAMKIGAIDKLTLLDFPGELAAIVFLAGCNFRCHYCYNPMLVVLSSKEGARDNEGHFSDDISEDDLFGFLESRRGKITGVVITGGEPTMHSDLEKLMIEIKQAGFKIKLDTNGSNPDFLARILDGEARPDYIAMDLKAPAEKYEQIIAVKIPDIAQKIQKSVKSIITSGVPYEFRTTVHPLLLNEGDIQKMGAMIHGAQKWYLQNVKTTNNLVNCEFMNTDGFTDDAMQKMAEIGGKFVKKCIAR